MNDLGRESGAGQTNSPAVSSDSISQVYPRALFAGQSTDRTATLREFLEERNCTVLHCVHRAELARRMRALSPHLVVISEPVLLDLLDTCRMVRTAARVPILVLGQTKTEDEEVLCLEYGADTYLAPGASPRRLHAHAAALLQRGLGQVYAKAETLLVFGEVRVDLQRQRVYRGDHEVDLPPKEYALLRFLVEHVGQALSRQALWEGVWQSSLALDRRTVDVHIHWLREKLEVDVGNPKLIRTVRRVGYCFDP
jgi:DNA-binding response OmpR family regulator